MVIQETGLKMKNKLIFEKMQKDVYAIYNQISENNKNLYHDHGIVHINNVISTIEEVLKELGYEDEFIYAGKIAALLHDIGYINGKEGHAERSYLMAKNYFKENEINTGYNLEILEAIKLHGGKEKTENILACALIFADKIDIKKDRLTSFGLESDEVSEFKYINDIKVNISNDTLTVCFIMDKLINKKKLESYYFIPKVFNAIESFSKVINKKPIIYFNNEKWLI